MLRERDCCVLDGRARDARDRQERLISAVVNDAIRLVGEKSIFALKHDICEGISTVKCQFSIFLSVNQSKFYICPFHFILRFNAAVIRIKRRATGLQTSRIKRAGFGVPAWRRTERSALNTSLTSPRCPSLFQHVKISPIHICCESDGTIVYWSCAILLEKRYFILQHLRRLRGIDSYQSRAIETDLIDFMINLEMPTQS